MEITIFFGNLGCSLSTASAAIYAKRDAIEKKIVRYTCVVFSLCILFSYTPAAICWLSTVVFGLPSSRY